MTWLQGRGDIAYRSQKPLRLRGDVTVAPDGFAIDAMKAEIDGGAVEGRVAVSHRQQDSGSRIRCGAEGGASRSRCRHRVCPFAGGPARPNGRTKGSSRSISAAPFRPVRSCGRWSPKLGYAPKTFSLDQLKIGQPGSVTLEGAGSFDRVNATGKLALNSSAASLGQITALIAPFAPSLAARLNAMGTSPGPARVKLTLDLDKNAGQADRANARAVVDIDAPQLKGVATITAKPAVAAIHGIDLDALGRSEFGIESKLSSGQGRALLALLGLDRTVAAGEGPAQFEGTATGAWGAPLRLKAKISGTGLDAEAEGSAEPWAQEAKASLNLKVRSADLGPLLDLKPADTLAQNIGLSSRVIARGQQADVRRSRQQHRRFAAARTPGGHAGRGERRSRAKSASTSLRLAPAFALAIGAAGHDAAEPLGAGLVKGWRGRVAFQALRGLLPGGSELQPVSGIVKSDGQSLTFDAVKGKIGGGEVTASIDARPGANGIALNASVQFSGVDGTALRYRNLAMPAGRASMQMTLTSQGRSASALTGALSGSGTVTLESRKVRRPRSARLRGRGPRQRQRAGEGRRQAEADRRAGAVGRRAGGRVGANSVHHPGRPASRRRHHARCQWRARHRLRRLRYSGRPGRYPRRACLDDDGRRVRKFSCLR